MPIITNNNDDDNAVRSRFLAVTRVVAYVSIPICVTIGVFSEPVVRILYGEKFLEAAPIVSIFAICTMLTSIAGFIDMLGIAKGRTDLNFKQTIYRIVITTPIIAATSLISIMAVAWGQLLILAITLTLYWRTVVMKTYPMPFRVYLSQFGRYMLVFCTTGLIVGILQFTGILRIVDNIAIRLIIVICIYILLLAIGMHLFLQEEKKFMLSIIHKKIK